MAEVNSLVVRAVAMAEVNSLVVRAVAMAEVNSLVVRAVAMAGASLSVIPALLAVHPCTPCGYSMGPPPVRHWRRGWHRESACD
jgi:hypothetical protein